MRGLAALALVVAACDRTPNAADVDAGGGAVDATVTTAPDAEPSFTPDAAASGPDAAVHACAPAPTAGHQTFGCPEGVEVEVEAPASCLAGGCPVVLDVHGYTMSADQQDTHTRMRSLATARGYVVVQPTAPGLPSSWGVGEHDDVVWDVLLATIDVFAIDPDRVHMTGFSQGGMMSFRQLCAHADRLASIAPIAGGGCFGGDAPAIERPIFYIHGHLDTIVPWSTVAVPQRDAMIAAWDLTAVADTTANTVKRTTYTSAAGTVVEIAEHDLTTGDFILAGHCVIGPEDNGTFRCDGSPYDMTVAILDFFDAHPRGE